jgi:lipopolysaccharide biosynthesis regulator YciM
MVLELLFLLLPVAAVSGWWVGRRSTAKVALPQTRDIPADYLKGLNFLLNEQPDKAIEVFIEMLEVNRDTVETHLALGSLFRRRGEVDRAIRIHQNLIARPTLSRGQRAQALFELGQDYMRAGLFDRAEALFTELVDSSPHTEAALRYLLDIYEQEKDWQNAVETARKLENRASESMSSRIAHYFCEMAENEERNGDTNKALRIVRRALAEDRASVRASLTEGRLEQQAGNYKSALRAYRRVEQQDPDYVPEIIEPVQACLHQLGRDDEAQAYLNDIQAKHGGISAVLAAADLRAKNDPDSAMRYIIECVKKRPSIRGMDRLIELQRDQSEGTARDNLQLLKDVTQLLLQDKPVYTCRSCGFAGKALHWHCPGCRKWDTIKPIHGVEGE